MTALIGHLNDPKKFASAVPMPTVAMDYVTEACPSSSTNMWRRPTWTNTNLFTIWGLRRYRLRPIDPSQSIQSPLCLGLFAAHLAKCDLCDRSRYGHVPGALEAAEKLQQVSHPHSSSANPHLLQSAVRVPTARRRWRWLEGTTRNGGRCSSSTTATGSSSRRSWRGSAARLPAV